MIQPKQPKKQFFSTTFNQRKRQKKNWIIIHRWWFFSFQIPTFQISFKETNLFFLQNIYLSLSRLYTSSILFCSFGHFFPILLFNILRSIFYNQNNVMVHFLIYKTKSLFDSILYIILSRESRHGCENSTLKKKKKINQTIRL